MVEFPAKYKDVALNRAWHGRRQWLWWELNDAMLIISSASSDVFIQENYSSQT